MDELAAVAAMAADAGANWIILFPQYSLGPGQSAIKRHIERVAGGVELPVMLQYAPGRPGSPSP
jgi:dihydrodipicolinate synthase/N-acetylneuraminate lyase